MRNTDYIKDVEQIRLSLFCDNEGLRTKFGKGVSDRKPGDAKTKNNCADFAPIGMPTGELI
jgi:hypothetical protein